MLRGDIEEALAAFDKALALDATLEPARLNRAVARLRANDEAGALADLEKITANEQSPLRAQAAYHTGIALDRLGKPDEAEKWLDQAATLDPGLDAARLYTGYLREQRQDYEGAARSYLDYLKNHPKSGEAALRLGVSAQKAGRLDVAKLYFERVIKDAPDSPQAVEARKFLVMWN